jgi:UDP-glucose 4-epimerase
VSTILITGGTGSFGSSAARRFLRDPKVEKVIIFSRDEKKQHDLRHELNTPRVDFIVGDVRDRDALDYAMNGVDYVFHAAALKHVPTGEYFPIEVVRTNVLGTENVLRAAQEHKIEKVVILSTDKAVYPINAMGMSKALAEKLVGASGRKDSNTTFCIVRYGNVMASRGSVIPLFIEYIKAGKPLPITDPKMTRFLLSLDDSIDLVALAIDKGRQGDLFIKKAPAATIGDLAEALSNIFGVKNRTRIVGLRAGEKIHETLATELELAHAEDLGNFYRIRNIAAEPYASFYEAGSVQQLPGDYTSEVTERLSVPQIEKLLRSLPEVKAEIASSKKQKPKKRK